MAQMCKGGGGGGIGWWSLFGICTVVGSSLFLPEQVQVGGFFCVIYTLACLLCTSWFGDHLLNLLWFGTQIFRLWNRELVDLT